jgi:hypothetical protein|tara:strand:- start:4841 stop:5395 length:555 start_codon:yes stop_codon:yes gene_type:complete
MSFSSQPGSANYEEIAANIPINNAYVNSDNSHDPSMFGSKDTSSQFGCHGISSNIDAAAASKIMMGGMKKKMKKISSKYRMGKTKTPKQLKRKLSNAKRKLISLLSKKNRKNHRSAKKKTSDKKKHNKTHKKRTRRHKQRGGYHQYMSNVPYTPSYSTGGELAPSSSALANPVPFQVTNNCLLN